MRQCPEKTPTTTKPPRGPLKMAPKFRDAGPTVTSIQPSPTTSLSANTSVAAIGPNLLTKSHAGRALASDNTTLGLSIAGPLLLTLLVAIIVYRRTSKRRCGRRRRRGPGPTMEAGLPESAELVGVAQTVEEGGGQGEQQEGWPTQNTENPGPFLPDSKFGKRVFKTP